MATSRERSTSTSPDLDVSTSPDLQVSSSPDFQISKLATFLATRASLRTIILIGADRVCLPASLPGIEVLVIGASPSPERAETACQVATVLPHDLESGLPDLPDDLVRNAVIVCAGVVERLGTPWPLLRQLAVLARRAPYLLLTTGDRERPATEARWSAPDFLRLLGDVGFGGVPFHGHIRATDTAREQPDIVVLDGTHTRIAPTVPSASVAGILHVYNEGDMLEETVRHLHAQGVAAHVFDHWSTDDTWGLLGSLRAAGLVAAAHRFPEAPERYYNLAANMVQTAAYARTLAADWVLSTDGDELRESPWAGVSMARALAHVAMLGFNAVDFTVVDFRFTSEDVHTAGGYEQRLRHFEFGRRPGHFVQVKGWRNVEGVELASSGGHNAMLPERRVFPLKFLLKHYPLRSPAQAARKVFHDRLPRYDPVATQAGWHVQYDRYRGHDRIEGWPAAELTAWHPEHFATDYVVERLSGIGLRD